MVVLWIKIEMVCTMLLRTRVNRVSKRRNKKLTTTLFLLSLYLSETKSSVAEKSVVESHREERTPVVMCDDDAWFLYVWRFNEKQENLSLFSAATSLSLSDNFFFSSCCGGKERQTSIVEKEDFWTKIKKEPLSFVSEKGHPRFWNFCFLSLCRRERLKRTKKRTPSDFDERTVLHGKCIFGAFSHTLAYFYSFNASVLLFLAREAVFVVVLQK